MLEGLSRRPYAVGHARGVKVSGRVLNVLAEPGIDTEHLVARLSDRFPDAALRDPSIAPTPGTRAEAERRLAELDPRAYCKTRNALDGAVSRLSPFIRHGVVTLAEARARALAKAPRSAAYKFVQELAWRDYYRRVYAMIGHGVWSDIEPYKTGHRAQSYAQLLPGDILAAQTGVPWIDGLITELHETGWLHNHARMWLAAYVVHFRRVRWQAGARWFLAHLIDGDPASNNLSWQWVASTFGHKPYIFNRANAEKYAAARFADLRAAPPADDPFATSYERLNARLFGDLRDGAGDPDPLARLAAKQTTLPASSVELDGPAVVWLTPDAIGQANTAAMVHAQAPRVFVLDAAWIDKAHITLKRLVFLAQAALDAGATLLAGDVADEVVAFARAHGARGVAMTASIEPDTCSQAQAIEARLPLQIVEAPGFLAPEPEFASKDLKRFSRYWRKAEAAAFVSDSGQLALFA